MSVELTKRALRPTSGKNGRLVRVRSNFFEVTNLTSVTICHYDVVIDPVDMPVHFNTKARGAFETQYEAGCTRSSHIKLRIKKANVINMHELLLFLKSKSACTTNCLTAIMFLDILFKNLPSTVHYSVGRSIYTPQDKRNLPNMAEVWQGFCQSARPTAVKLLLKDSLCF
ncbi:hypothetical protein BDF20DRAFT_943986 [Mycotypha africana]|uniref:uncharacterized protein n=1 Tax=Mycotypha africana TaxID=64632 RepID=UPI00230138B5|nr:uncharacterized protein BDF20DRAFT_943986 [Mycotypha africana]KAI8975371.1 hypothetical protein BDF20DRAFT_943986 [Mycotypha africana]